MSEKHSEVRRLLAGRGGSISKSLITMSPSAQCRKIKRVGGPTNMPVVKLLARIAVGDAQLTSQAGHVGSVKSVWLDELTGLVQKSFLLK